MARLLCISIFCLFFVVAAVAVDQFGTTPVAPVNPTGMPGMPGGPPPGMPGMPGMPTQQRNTQLSPEQAAAQQEIETQLNGLLSAVNQGTAPDPAILAQAGDTVKKYLPSIQKMDTKGQSLLQMLNAWTSYFASKLPRAKIAANAAYRSDQQNKDAQATYIMMAVANNDIKGAKNAISLIRKKAAKPTPQNQQDMSSQMYGGAPKQLLDFDVNSVNAELLGSKVGEFEVGCINGTSLPFKGGKTLLILLWKNSDLASTDGASAAQAPMPMMMPGMPGMPGMGAASGQTLTPLQAFGALFANEFQNEKITFLGLNLDEQQKNSEVMATLLKNPWPWPQAMAQEHRNAALASLAAAHTGKPALVVIGPDGEIKYAGSISGIILKVMSGYTQQDAKITQEPNTPAAPQASEPKEANAPPAAAPTPPPKPTPQPKAQLSEEEKLNPAASDLYQFALSQKRMAHVTGYGKMVEACRQILREYPASSEAEKARLLLREIPERKRAQFNIKNDEMGL